MGVVKVNWGGKDSSEKVNRLEPGEYEAKLKKFEPKTAQSGREMWVAHWEILNPPEGVNVWPIRENYMVDGVSWKWQQLLEAAGIQAEEDEELDLDLSDLKELVGLEATVVLEDNVYNNNTRSQVKRVKPL